MPSFTPRNKRVMCPHCEDVFARGRGFNKHVRFCLGGSASSEEETAVAAVLEHADNVDMGGDDDNIAEVAEHEDAHSIADHFDCLEALGTLDLSHVLQYSTWGRTRVKDDVVEICRFLRSTEIGGGSSDGKAQAHLDYAKTLHGRGDLLPKTLKTCWAKVDRARYSVLHEVHYRIHF